MELRVLSGPQAGCSLPLGAGLYRAGGDEHCDVVLEGLPPGEAAFVIYVGHRTLALESLVDGLRVDGRPARGLCELAAGTTFELLQWVFAVDEPEAPWPAEGSWLRGPEQEDTPDGTAEAVPAVEEAVDFSAADALPAPADVPAVANAPRRRARIPFWAAGLLGTAAFIGLGVVALAMTLAPTQIGPAPAAQGPEAILRRLAASADADLALEQLPTGRWRLAGHVATRVQKLDVIRQARAADPAVLIRIGADEDLAARVREVLALFPDSGAQFGGLHLGHLTLTGRVPEGQLRERIVAAVQLDVPGLAALDNQITATDDSLVALRELLAGAGLAERLGGALDSAGTTLVVTGAPDEAERQRWLEVHAALVARFGDAPRIVERFAMPSAAIPALGRTDGGRRGDVVAVVMGPMPYEMLRDGTRRVLPAGGSGR